MLRASPRATCSGNPACQVDLGQGDVAAGAPLNPEDAPGGRFDDVPRAVGGAEHRDVRLAVAVVVGRHHHVGAVAPLHDAGGAVARLPDVPVAVRRTEHGDVGLAVAV